MKETLYKNGKLLLQKGVKLIECYANTKTPYSILDDEFISLDDFENNLIKNNSNFIMPFGKNQKINNHFLSAISVELKELNAKNLDLAFGELEKLYNKYNELYSIYRNDNKEILFFFYHKSDLKTQTLKENDIFSIKILSNDSYFSIPGNTFENSDILNENTISVNNEKEFKDEYMTNIINFLNFKNINKYLVDFGGEIFEAEKTAIERLKERVISLKDVEIFVKNNIKENYEIEQYLQDIVDALNNSNIKMKITQVRKIMNDMFKKAKVSDVKLVAPDILLCQYILEKEFNGGKHIVCINEQFFLYQDGIWRMTGDAYVKKIVIDRIQLFLNEDVEEKYGVIKDDLVMNLKKITKFSDEIFTTLVRLTTISEHDDLLNLTGKKENKYNIINTKNKELHLINGEIVVKDHSYDSYLLSQINTEYDPNADCPIFKEATYKWFSHNHDAEEIARHFYEVLGYAIMTKKPIPIWVLFMGGGDNGKSLAMNIIMQLLGIDTCISTDITKFSENSHAETELLGKHLLVDDDFKKNKILDDGFIKKISEEKLLLANPKFQKPFSFKSKVTPFILSNHHPKTRDTSWGIERRLEAFPFNKQFTAEEKDFNLVNKLRKEFPGILNLLIESYFNLEKRNFQFKTPLSCQNIRQEWVRASNALRGFIAEKVIVTGIKDKDNRIAGQTLYDKYKTYVDQENCSNALTRSNFYEDIKSIKGISMELDGTDRKYYIYGIKMKG